MKLAKRTYDDVSLTEEAGLWALKLDSIIPKTPEGHPLAYKAPLLMEAIANEWRAQGEQIDPNRMPRTRLLTIALDRIPHHRDSITNDIVGYAETDLLCYRATQPELALRQSAVFEPVLEWAFDEHGLVFDITDSAMPVAQPKQTIETVRFIYDKCNHLGLSALAVATPVLGSVVLALALKARHINAEEAIAAARIEETAAAEFYGEDPETEARWAEKLIEIQACSAALAAAS